MAERADAHMHLFEGGFQGGSFTSRPGVNIDELACYRSLMDEHDIVAALVVGYEGQAWCAANNQHLAQLAADHLWIKPTAFIDPVHPPGVKQLEAWREAGFVGLSLYVLNQTQAAALGAMDEDVWRFIETHRWLISVNSKGESWSAWPAILDKHDQLRLVASHMGLPPRVQEAPSDLTGLTPITALAHYPQVHVKLSAFYAVTEPGHEYPHRAAWPYVEALVEAFGADRLLWGSDFSPCLDTVSFPQTLDVLRHMPFLTQQQRQQIEGGNLLRLLEAARR